MNSPGDCSLDATSLKRCGGPEESLNVTRRDGRTAEAMRAGHNPFTRFQPATAYTDCRRIHMLRV